MTIVEARSEPWASATFLGARHALTVAADACPALQRWLAMLPELELPLAGHLVADVQAGRTTRVDAQMQVALDVLTVEER